MFYYISYKQLAKQTHFCLIELLLFSAKLWALYMLQIRTKGRCLLIRLHMNDVFTQFLLLFSLERDDWFTTVQGHCLFLNNHVIKAKYVSITL